MTILTENDLDNWLEAGPYETQSIAGNVIYRRGVTQVRVTEEDGIVVIIMESTI